MVVLVLVFMAKRKGRRRRQTKKCPERALTHALCFHHCRLFGRDPYPWLCGSAASAANTSALDTAFAELAAIVRQHGTEEDVVSRRLQSIAAWPPQTSYYAAVVRRPGISTVCEVGFNAGHSAVVLLQANPSVRLETFDLFSYPHSADSLSYVMRRFPGRVTPHKGRSAQTVPAASLSARCDLVIIDGRHEFEAVVEDMLNFRRLASPDALFLVMAARHSSPRSHALSTA